MTFDHRAPELVSLSTILFYYHRFIVGIGIGIYKDYGLHI